MSAPAVRRGGHLATTVARAAVALVLGLALLAGGAGFVAIAEAEDAPGHGIVDWAETQIRSNETVHYNVHVALGRFFSLCPCTRRIANSQYAKAAYHRPRPSRTP